MASPAPAWRVKTRPCPFYQQGRCLFEDSCNFMHNVSVKRSPDPISVPATPKATFPSPPVVTIQSPQSIRSPPRSPRMSDLLFALRDVIGDEPEDNFEDSTEGTTLCDTSTASDTANVASIHLEDKHTVVCDPQSPSSGVVPPGDDGSFTPAECPGNRSSDAEYSTVYPSEQAVISDLLSPVNLSQLNLAAFAHFDNDSPSKDCESIDSGYADTWTAPQPFIKSPHRSSLNSTLDLISSPFGAPSSRVLSPRLSAFIPTSPFSSPLSAVVDPSDLSLDSPAKDPGDGVILDDSASTSPELSQSLYDSVAKDVEGQESSEDTYGPGPASSGGSSEAQTTAVYLDMPPLTPKEVDNAILRPSPIPTHFLARTIDFVEEEADNGFSAVSRSPSPTPSKERGGESASGSEKVETGVDRAQTFSDGSFTTKLAYLSSPAIHANDNDALSLLYDDYSTIPNEPGTSTILSINTDTPPSPERPLFAKSPVTCEPMPERVSTPPLVQRGHSGVVSADSPASSSSPRIFPDVARAPRLASHSRGARSVRGPDSPLSDVKESSQSKKIPFGFRHSRPVSRARYSSLDSDPSPRPPAPPSDRISSSQSDRTFSPDRSSPLAGGLRPLKLSSILGPVPSSAPSGNSHFSITSIPQSRNIHRLSISSTNVSSESSISSNPLLCSARSSPIPKHIRNTLFTSQDISPSSSYQSERLSKLDEPPGSRPKSPTSRISIAVDNVTQTICNGDRSSRGFFSVPSFGPEDEKKGEGTTFDHTIRRPLPVVSHTAPVSRTASIIRPPMYAIATPPPALMFAIASDDVHQVRRVLENGSAGPNDPVGPQSALAFALTNDQLSNKVDIVKTLLAYGADPAVLRKEGLSFPPHTQDDSIVVPPPSKPLIDALDPAIRYYVERADAPHTRRRSALIHRSFFRPLTRVQYELIGQDRALEQLFQVLSIHSRQLSVTPIVVLLCGPSGHGKSLLARKFGSLLDVPTHTVNMTVLNSTQDLWQSYSMSPYETPTTCTLAEFLINNEGKRCVVVLDEIEKTRDEKTLWSLLMPWELGRCAFEANGRHVDVRNVVWLGTSNVGHDLVFEHNEARTQPYEVMSREEYVALMGLLRPRVSARLGASILSRVTTVLPFVPFTLEERRAICFEALHTVAGEVIRTLATDVVDSMVDGALANYISSEGARSLYRAVSNQLVDNI